MNHTPARLAPLCAAALLLAALPALAASSLGTSSSTAACCQLTTTLGADAIAPQDVPGDERFFMSDGAPPNIHFLLDTSCSMKELPQLQNSQHEAFFALGGGCTNTALVNFQASRGWDPNKVYPVPDQGTGIGSDTGKPGLFPDGAFYGYMRWYDAQKLDAPPPTWTSREAVCQHMHPNWNTDANGDGVKDGLAAYNSCLNCMQTRGFYRKPGTDGNLAGVTLPQPGTSPSWVSNDFAVSGRFLNFNPPKYVIGKVVMKQVIKDLRRVRAGISVYDSNGSGASLVRGQNPSCDQIIKNSSSFDSNRGSYISAVDALKMAGGTPLARSLLNIGQMFSSTNDVYKTKFGFSDYDFKSAYKNDQLTSQGRSWCWGCQISSVVVISDGEPSGDSLPSTTLSRVQALNGGSVTCPPEYPCNDSGDEKLDDVARLLARQDLQQNTPVIVGDLNTAGRQSMTVYTIGLGLDSNLLRNTAKEGDGEYYTTTDIASLKAAILDIIRNVETRATSFSATAVASLQVNRAGGTLVPRFKPSRGSNRPWQGFLFRFSLAPEILLGCTKDPVTGTNNKDLNGDNDCDDIHLIDKNGKAVVEDDQGNFVLLEDSVTPAVPFWEAGKVLKPTTGASTVWTTRRIYTVIDTSGPAGVKDNKIDRWDTPIEFKQENAALLQEYLGISDNSAECAALATRLGELAMTPLKCAQYVINWYRGADVLNIDPTKRGQDRPFLLHDIFHSSPISVEPPTPKFFCGYSNQCLDTLYSGKTLKERYPQTDGTELDAYDEFLRLHGNRARLVLVGSNGGMLHAFNNGRVDTTNFPPDGKDPVTGLYEYTAGTGQEEWAFIPPDLLPKLRARLGEHAYFVDGTPMVRDVWLDLNNDKKKQAGEYRTIAVVGTGTGGVHRFALDLTRLLPTGPTTPHRMPDQAGDFLWMWPQPCDPLALQLGESFSNFTPKPPPIGPVAIADPAGLWSVNNTNAREQWMVFLNGGHDPYLVRGRGLAMVDLATGNTLWSMFHGDPETRRPRASLMRYPISAGVSLMDLGNSPSSTGDADLLFDTAVVGDYGGQVWTVRFWQPGVVNTGTGQMDNWLAARSFHIAQTDAQKTNDALLRPVFSYIAANTIQPDTGYMRTFLGTGDRYNLVDVKRTCRLSNPLACANLGCEVRNTIRVYRGNSLTPLMTSTSSFADGAYNATTLPTLSLISGNSCEQPRVRHSWDYEDEGNCNLESTSAVDYSCTGDSTSWGCTRANGWAFTNLADPTTTPPSVNRFYGFWNYGVNPERTFNTAAEAALFDAARVRDSDLTDVSQFDATGQVLATTTEAGSLGKGWYIRYTPPAERTGTGSTIIDGCVIWSSFEPSGSQSAVCSATGTNLSRIYQASFVTGKADCARSFDRAAGTQRFIQNTTVAAPPEPAPQRTLVNGKVYTSAVVPGVGGGGAGGAQQFVVGENKEVLQSVYQLEIDRAAHECRHEGNAAQCQ